ncbi:MAG: phosphatidylglycerol lysyltransferase, partial [Spirochaetia bacterium]
GESLNLCRELLERESSYDPGFIFGYVPDADGDRGNLVYTDEGSGTALPMDAQEVFALAVLAELTWNITVRKDAEEEAGETFVVVNGPTSLRIDRIARALGVKVARAEVGEANVINLAARLRMMGRTVPILGEGSNGGNITHPSKVRDPIHTIFSAAKLLTLPELFDTWSGARNFKPEAGPITFSKIRSSLPGFVTTSVFEKRALVSIKTENQGDLKKRYEKIFLREWENMKGSLEKKWGITGYYEVNYEGSSEQRGFGPNYRSGSQRGGLKMVFTREAEPVGFLWMRGSGTEPVFRVMADIESTDPADEKFLLEWHKEMVAQADRPAG